MVPHYSSKTSVSDLQEDTVVHSTASAPAPKSLSLSLSITHSGRARISERLNRCQ